MHKCFYKNQIYTLVDTPRENRNFMTDKKEDGGSRHQGDYIQANNFLTFVKSSPSRHERRSSDKIFITFRHTNGNNIRLEVDWFIEP